MESSIEHKLQNPPPRVLEVLEDLLETQGSGQSLEESWAMLVAALMEEDS